MSNAECSLPSKTLWKLIATIQSPQQEETDGRLFETMYDPPQHPSRVLMSARTDVAADQGHSQLATSVCWYLRVFDLSTTTY